MNPCSRNTHKASYAPLVSSSEEKTSCERKTEETSRASLEQLSFLGTTPRFDSYIRRLREMNLLGLPDLEPVMGLSYESDSCVFPHLNQISRLSELSTVIYSDFVSAERIASISSTPVNGGEIAEALQSELAITTAGDAKPIVGTYGCGPCVAVAGYEPTNKIAFTVHFANAGEVRKSGGLIFWNISKLVKTPITSPIQLHLRGGVEGESEGLVEAIRVWMRQRRDLPMEIVSEDILANPGSASLGKSIQIDSRTGEVSEYDPMTNAKSRDISKLDAMRIDTSAFKPNITLAYLPKSS